MYSMASHNEAPERLHEHDQHCLGLFHQQRGLDRNIESYKDLFQQGTEGQNYAMKGVGPDSKENAGHTYHRLG